MQTTLTPTDAAKVLNCSERKVRALIRKQKIKAIDTSTGDVRPRWRIPPDELQRFMDCGDGKTRTTVTKEPILDQSN